MSKRAVYGFKGIVLAPITTDSIIAYVTGTVTTVPYAGSLNLTAKESKQDIYYDDALYAQLRDVSGYDAEIRIGEITLAKAAELGLGTHNVAANVMEADFSITNKSFALRFALATVGGKPRYVMYRVFDLQGIRYDNYQTKKDSPTVCEVILTGVVKKPELASLKPMVIMELADDDSNQAACDSFLTSDEPYAITYAAGGGTGTQAAGSAFAAKAFTLPVCTFTYDAHTFSKWDVGGTQYDAGAAVVFTGDTTVTAVWVSP